MSLIVDWVSTIIIFILLATIINLILPNTNLQKYVKMVVGLLLVVIIINPIFTIFQTDVFTLLQNFQQDEQVKSIESEINSQKNEIQLSEQAYILNQMEQQMMNQVANRIETEYSYGIIDLEIVPNNSQEIVSKEDIEKIIIQLEPAQSGIIKDIQNVEINLEEPLKTTNDNTIEIKQLLAEEWQISGEQVEISIGRGR